MIRLARAIHNLLMTSRFFLCRFDYVREHRDDGVTVIFANPSKKVVRQLENARLVQHIGARFFCPSACVAAFLPAFWRVMSMVMTVNWPNSRSGCTENVTPTTCAGAEHIFVRSADAVEYALEQQLVANKGKKGSASAI